MTIPGFVPFDPEIKPATLVKLNIGYGDFYVSSAGQMREVENIIFYGDALQQMYVYCETAPDPGAGANRFKIIVFAANKKRLGGGPFAIPSSCQTTIEANLTYVLTTRRFHRLSELAHGDNIASKVEFTWDVAP